VKIEIEALTGASAGKRQNYDGRIAIRIGRDPSCEFALNPHKDLKASAQHGEIFFKDGIAHYRDLKSSNGSFIDGNKVEPDAPVPLQDGVTLTLGAAGPKLRIGLPDSVRKRSAQNPLPPEAVEAIAYQASEAHSRRTMLTMTVIFGIMLTGVFAAVAILTIRRNNETTTIVDKEKIAAEAELRRIASDIRITKDRIRFFLSTIESYQTELIAIRADSSMAPTIRRMTETSKEKLISENALRLDVTKAELDALTATFQDAEKNWLARYGALPDGLIERPSFKEWCAQNGPAVFLVYCEVNDAAYIGTAFCARSDGLLITNAHVATHIDPVTDNYRIIQNETQAQFKARRVVIHPDYNPNVSSPGLTVDLAVIQLEKSSGAPIVAVSLADDEILKTLAPGSQLGCLSFPGALFQQYDIMSGHSGQDARVNATFSDGSVSRITTLDGAVGSFENRALIQHSAILSGGTSGAPMFLPTGEVVAINYAVLSTPDANAPAGIGWAIRADYARRMILSWKDN
jgi:pSer/pThr/pTyr-binding forkhead associated (FHA) protein/S1-C subfamily serine protease